MLQARLDGGAVCVTRHPKDAGRALMEIRDERLYREQYATFEDYCQQRWGMSRSYAHRQIEAAQVISLLPIGNKPKSESQARELAPLLDRPDAADVIPAVWREVQESGEPVTAARVRGLLRMIRNWHGFTGSGQWGTHARA